VDRWAVVNNQGDAPITLESVQSATWHVPRSRDYRLTHLSGDWGREYRIEHVDLTQAAHSSGKVSFGAVVRGFSCSAVAQCLVSSIAISANNNDSPKVSTVFAPPFGCDGR
jgi:hypothetical protein